MSLDALSDLAATECVLGLDLVRRGPGLLVFTDEGRAKISALARGAFSHAQNGTALAAPLAVAPREAPDAGEGPNREDLRISRANLSPRCVLALRPNGNEVVVLVKTTALLAAGMVLKSCIQDSPVDPQSWSYQGPLPRTLGQRQLFYA